MPDLRFLITPRAERWLAGANVLVDLRIENHSGDAVRFPNPLFKSSPQPVYELLREGEAEGLRFTPQDPDVEADVTETELPDGSAWEGDLALGGHTGRLAPGRYTLRARIEWGDLVIESEPARFEVMPVELSRLALVLHRGATGVGDSFAVAIQAEDPARPEAAATVILEEDADIGEVEIDDLWSLGPLPADARGLVPVAANFPSADDLGLWMVCPTPDGLWVGDDSGAEPATVPGAATLLAPRALALRGRRLWLPALRVIAGGAELGLARVGPEERGGEAELRELRRFDAAPSAFDAALGPESLESPVVLVLAWPEGPATRTLWLRLDAGGKIAAEREIRLEGRLLEGALAARISGPEGRIRVSLVTAHGELGKDAEVRVADLDAPLALDEEPRETGSARFALDGDASWPRALVALDGPLGAAPGRAVMLLRDERPAQSRVDGRGFRKSTAQPGRDASVSLVRGQRTWYAVEATPAGIRAEML